MTKLDMAKYFWSLNRAALREVEFTIKNPAHRRFPERMVTFLSRCNKPKELFSLISRQQFIESWPRIKTYWKKSARQSDFRSWWQTVYEQILEDYRARQIRPKGSPATAFIKIGKIIKEARIKKALSQNELAGKAMMKQPDISMIEEGKQNITIDTLIRLCRILGIKKIDIGGDDNGA
jgi:UDP-N-acetylglucosamine 1-carboxyvinyltransferase